MLKKKSKKEKNQRDPGESVCQPKVSAKGGQLRKESCRREGEGVTKGTQCFLSPKELRKGVSKKNSLQFLVIREPSQDPIFVQGKGEELLGKLIQLVYFKQRKKAK